MFRLLHRRRHNVLARLFISFGSHQLSCFLFLVSLDECVSKETSIYLSTEKNYHFVSGSSQGASSSSSDSRYNFDIITAKTYGCRRTMKKHAPEKRNTQPVAAEIGIVPYTLNRVALGRSVCVFVCWVYERREDCFVIVMYIVSMLFERLFRWRSEARKQRTSRPEN